MINYINGKIWRICPDEIRTKLDEVEQKKQTFSSLFLFIWEIFQNVRNDIFHRNQTKYFSTDYLNERKFRQNSIIEIEIVDKKKIFSISRWISLDFSFDFRYGKQFIHRYEMMFYLHFIYSYQHLNTFQTRSSLTRFVFLLKIFVFIQFQGQKSINQLVNHHRSNSHFHHQQENFKLIFILCQSYAGNNIEMSCTIYQENPMKIIREINWCDDEIQLLIKE